MKIRARAFNPVIAAALISVLIGLGGGARGVEGSEQDTTLSGVHDTVQRLMGSRVRVHDAQLEDAFAAGGEVEFERVTADDLFVAGGSLRLREVAAEDLVAAGGEIHLHAQIRDDLLAAGGRVRLDARSTINGDAVVAGGAVELAGRIDGNVTAAGGRVVLAGIIGGDVDVSAAEVVLEPGARIGGQLRYRSGDEARISPQAVIGGGVLHEPSHAPKASGWTIAGVAAGVLLVVLIGLVVLAAAVQALIPRPIDRAVRGFRAQPGTSWLIGFALLVAVPVAANVLLITIIGIPLGLLFYSLYAAGLTLGAVTAAHELGRLLTRGARAGGEEAISIARLGRMALGMLLLLVLALIPVLGWLGLLAVIPAGIGAFAIECRRRVHAAAPAAEHA